MQPFREEECVNRKENLFPTLTVKQALELMKMAKGSTLDMQDPSKRTTYIYGRVRSHEDQEYCSEHWIKIDKQLEKVGFYKDILETRIMTCDSEGMSEKYKDYST